MDLSHSVVPLAQRQSHHRTCLLLLLLFTLYVCVCSFAFLFRKQPLKLDVFVILSVGRSPSLPPFLCLSKSRALPLLLSPWHFLFILLFHFRPFPLLCVSVSVTHSLTLLIKPLCYFDLPSSFSALLCFCVCHCHSLFSSNLCVSLYVNGSISFPEQL